MKVATIQSVDTGEVKFFTEEYYAEKYRARKNDFDVEGEITNYPWSKPDNINIGEIK